MQTMSDTHSTHNDINRAAFESMTNLKSWRDQMKIRCDPDTLWCVLNCFFFKYIFDVLSFLSWKSNGLHNQFIIISCIEMCAMRKCNSLYWNCKIDFNAYTWAHRQRCIFKRVSILFLAPDLLLWSAPICRSN